MGMEHRQQAVEGLLASGKRGIILICALLPGFLAYFETKKCAYCRARKCGQTLLWGNLGADPCKSPSRRGADTSPLLASFSAPAARDSLLGAGRNFPDRDTNDLKSSGRSQGLHFLIL